MAYEDFTPDMIHGNMLTNISNDIDKREGSVTHDLTYPAAIELGNAYVELDTVLAMGMPQTATGEFLENIAYAWSIERRDAVKAIGEVTLTSIKVPTVIPAGTRLQTTNDDPIYFVTDEAVEYVGEPITVSATAEAGGTEGNVSIGEINSLAAGDLYGIVTVTNAEPFDGGADIEDDETLRERLFERARRPITSGNAYHYEMWAKEIDGIGDAKIYPLWDGAGTVKVVLVDSTHTAPTDELVTEVAEHIEENRPIGADVTVVGATEIPINVTATIELADASTLEDVKDDLEDAIVDHLADIAFVGEPVRYSEIAGLVIGLAGVRDYTNLTVNGGTTNVAVADDAVAVLGTVTLS